MDHRSNLGVLRQQQELVLKADPLLRWVETSHLAFEVMESGQPHYHFGTQGQLQLGEEFANAYLRDIKHPIPVADRLFENGLPIVGKSRVRLFVMAGQRNMEGEDAYVAAIPAVPGFESLTKNQDQVLYRYSLGGGRKTSIGWEPLGPIDYLGNFGPELSFAASMQKSMDASEGIAIVKFTHSGAQGPDWFPQGSPEAHRNLYPKFISFVRAAQEDLIRQGFDGNVEAILWHTGENDTYFGPYASNNAKWMQQLIDRVRLDLKQPALRWLITEQHQEAPWRNIDSVNAALNELSHTDPRITIVKTSHLPYARHHFGTLGTLRLGEELAKAYWSR